MKHTQKQDAAAGQRYLAGVEEAGVKLRVGGSSSPSVGQAQGNLFTDVPLTCFLQFVSANNTRKPSRSRNYTPKN